MMRIWMVLGVLAGWSVSQYGYAVAGQDIEPDKQLRFMIVSVNGSDQKVVDGEELVVVAGDEFEIKEAVLGDPKQKASAVNLIGYQSAKARTRGEDRGYTVHSERDLLKYWSVHKKGELFRVKVSSGRVQHGEVFIRVLQPKLQFAELMINGRKKLLREGELLRLKKSDEISVANVRTNVAEDGEKVDFQIIPKEEIELPGVKLFELHFSRAGKVFARIPMQIEGYEVQPKD